MRPLRILVVAVILGLSCASCSEPSQGNERGIKAVRALSTIQPFIRTTIEPDVVAEIKIARGRVYLSAADSASEGDLSRHEHLVVWMRITVLKEEVLYVPDYDPVRLIVELEGAGRLDLAREEGRVAATQYLVTRDRSVLANGEHATRCRVFDGRDLGGRDRIRIVLAKSTGGDETRFEWIRVDGIPRLRF